MISSPGCIIGLIVVNLYQSKFLAMKNKILRSVATLTTAFYIGMMSACSTGAAHSDHDHDHHEHNDEDHDSEHDHADGEIVVEPADAERFGIETQEVAEQPFSDVVRVSGQIISSSADQAVLTAVTPGIVTFKGSPMIGEQVGAHQTIATISASSISGGDPNNAARVAVESAKRQLDRLEPLLKEGIVTRREYDEALAQYKAAQTAYTPTASSGTVTSPFAGVITQLFVSTGQYVELGTPVATIAKNSTLVLRADLPEKYRPMIDKISSATFRPTYSEKWMSIDSLGGKRTQAATGQAVAKAGYIPIYFSIDNDGSLSNGTFIDVCLISDDSTPAISLPTEAIIEQQGAYFAYIKTGDHSYEKRKLTLGETAGDRSRIISGLQPGDNVVVKGAIVVKLAESSGAVPEGHSHNH